MSPPAGSRGWSWQTSITRCLATSSGTASSRSSVAWRWRSELPPRSPGAAQENYGKPHRTAKDADNLGKGLVDALLSEGRGVAVLQTRTPPPGAVQPEGRGLAARSGGVA